MVHCLSTHFIYVEDIFRHEFHYFKLNCKSLFHFWYKCWNSKCRGKSLVLEHKCRNWIDTLISRIPNLMIQNYTLTFYSSKNINLQIKKNISNPCNHYSCKFILFIDSTDHWKSKKIQTRNFWSFCSYFRFLQLLLEHLYFNEEMCNMYAFQGSLRSFFPSFKPRWY